MRLIDADKLMQKLNEYFYDTTNPAARRAAHDTMALCQSLVDEQPTAYDVDNVVKQLEKAAGESVLVTLKAAFKVAVDIVKSGYIE